MQKILFVLVAVCCLVACAGNPPAWWNPTGQPYPSAKTQKAATAKPAQVATHPAVPAEQYLLVQDETYEEMTLTPLQDEEGENESGDSSAQSIVPPEDEAFLPPPSILEE